MRLLARPQQTPFLISNTLFRTKSYFPRFLSSFLGGSHPDRRPNSRSVTNLRVAPSIRCLSLSSVVGDSTSSLDERTLPEYFEGQLLSSYAGRVALICRAETRNRFGGPIQQHDGQHLRWTFAEFNKHVDALARGLMEMGVYKGDRVAVIMGNTSSYATLQWACAMIGAILVTINPAYRSHELVSALNNVGVSTLVVVPSIRTSDYLSMLLSQAPGLAATRPGEDLNVPEIPMLRRIIVDDHNNASSFGGHSIRATHDFRETFVWERSSQEKNISLHNEDVINLLFTSGTAGTPKAVSLTHRNILNNAVSIGRCMDIGPGDIVFNVPPLFHCFGLLGNLAAWIHGAGVLYPSPTFSPASIVDSLTGPYPPDESCSALYGVPTHFLEVLQEIQRRGLTSGDLGGRLRTGIASGSPVPIELMRALRDEMGINGLTVAYGMTETSPVSFQTTTSEPLHKRVETVGRVQPHVRAKIIGREGQILPIDTPGELCVSGYLLQKGYWNDEEQTREAMKMDEEGTLWMHTGDQGVMDSEGYLRIVGRIKDIIVRGGENLYPVQIENLLLTHPDVLETAVIAVPDPHYGEVVGVWIVLRPGATMNREEVRRIVKEGMNPQNAPTWVWFVGDNGLDQLPKTASGKVQKHVLRSISARLAKDGRGKVMSGGTSSC